MSAIDVLWHLLNFLAPTLAVGALVAVSAKSVWRRALRSTPIVCLALIASAGAAVGYIASIVWLGRDGAIAAYAAMLISTSLTVGWIMMRARSD